MRDQDFISHLSQILDVTEDKITMEYPLMEDEWDSLATMAVMAGIDKFYDVVVPTKEIMKCKTVGDLMTLIEDMVKKKG